MENDNTKKVNPDETVHVIDGIVELNHPAPFWWQMIFYISIIWAIGYMGYYLFGGGPTLKQELAAKLENINQSRKSGAPSEEQDKSDLHSFYQSPERLAHAAQVFQKNCVACHAADGGGGIGPNLTDNHWIHGDGTIDAIWEVVKTGVPEKGMPPWGPVLNRDEVLEVAAYVRSLRGKTTAKPKPPQGNAVDAKADI